jgi:hypothetical protein
MRETIPAEFTRIERILRSTSIANLLSLAFYSINYRRLHLMLENGHETINTLHQLLKDGIVVGNILKDNMPSGEQVVIERSVESTQLLLQNSLSAVAGRSPLLYEPICWGLVAIFAIASWESLSSLKYAIPTREEPLRFFRGVEVSPNLRATTVSIRHATPHRQIHLINGLGFEAFKNTGLFGLELLTHLIFLMITPYFIRAYEHSSYSTFRDIGFNMRSVSSFKLEEMHENLDNVNYLLYIFSLCFLARFIHFAKDTLFTQDRPVGKVTFNSLAAFLSPEPQPAQPAAPAQLAPTPSGP